MKNNKRTKTEMMEYVGLEILVGNIPCYVARCDREIGITIRKMSDDKEYFCLNKNELLSATAYYRSNLGITNRLYHEAITHTLEQIEKGIIEEDNTIWHTPGKQFLEFIPIGMCCGSSLSCAFSE